ncbi:hypothetical protein CDAR_513951 [Caerostris darwini]|uniref:Uncharacterized protein n=1 Tax=Caerostris darwini TaxID=1538125 RepID=A0AAV4WNU0_9ARAC|nr:hypothetical protein CDAR_513951 [Caerostris darwini]
MDECDTLDRLEGNWSRNNAVFNNLFTLPWDSFQAHFTNKMKAMCLEMKRKMVVRLGGRTSMLQPPDIYLIKLFKDRHRFKWIEWLWQKSKP